MLWTESIPAPEEYFEVCAGPWPPVPCDVLTEATMEDVAINRRPVTIRQCVDAFNRDRIPELVERKYAKMARDAFVFFRGTAHLFWEDWPSAAQGLDDAPLAWSCGDLHLENFGSYRGDNGLSYFDLNDFDDASLAPATR